VGAFDYNDATKNEFSYVHRLISDIEAKKKIKLDSGTNVKFYNSNKITELKKLTALKNENKVITFLKTNANNVFVDSQTNIGYRFTQIDKLPYSKGKGSGAGTEITKLSESAVCVALASLVHLGEFNLDENITINAVDKVLDLGSSNTKQEIKKVLNWLKMDEKWLNSVMITAKKIKSKLGNKLTKSHHFHRDSVFMNSIYKKFQEHLKPLNKLNIRISNDKWNPSDIWISNKSDLPATNDIVSLNKVLLNGFKQAEIVGISLKKTGASVNYSVYNIDKQHHTFKFKSIKPQSSPFSSKDVVIETVAGLNMQIRTFGVGQSVQVELKGKFANNGKCGFGATKHIIKSLANRDICDNTKIKSMTRDKILSEINKFYGQVFSSKPSISALEAELDNKGFKSNAVALDYLTSKLQALQIASAIKNDKEKDLIVTGIYGYAHSLGLSEMFEASVYAKVY
jgi:hypothetical protein|tara:strand:+ start:771 stop:2135 length:1365 start_codon:yes stop_codon:yes gene_type:complete